MAYEQRDNSGSLFVNDRRDGEKVNQPHRTGTAMVGGKLYRVAAWEKKTKTGAEYLSISFTPKQDQPPKDEDLPF